jgi:hypothetical protein
VTGLDLPPDRQRFFARFAACRDGACIVMNHAK